MLKNKNLTFITLSALCAPCMRPKVKHKFPLKFVFSFHVHTHMIAIPNSGIILWRVAAPLDEPSQLLQPIDYFSTRNSANSGKQ